MERRIGGIAKAAAGNVMTEDTPPDEPEADAVTAPEIATGMTDEQLRDAWDAVTGGENLTDLETAVSAEMERRNLDI